MRTDFQFVCWDNVEEHIRSRINDAVQKAFVEVQDRILLEDRDVTLFAKLKLDECVMSLSHKMTDIIEAQAERQVLKAKKESLMRWEK